MIDMGDDGKIPDFGEVHGRFTPYRYHVGAGGCWR
jgi:hypothetical protein